MLEEDEISDYQAEHSEHKEEDDRDPSLEFKKTSLEESSAIEGKDHEIVIKEANLPAMYPGESSSKETFETAPGGKG
jgi:hypothetical protein